MVIAVVGGQHVRRVGGIAQHLVEVDHRVELVAVADEIVHRLPFRRRRRWSESRSGRRLSALAGEPTPSVMESPRIATEPRAVDRTSMPLTSCQTLVCSVTAAPDSWSAESPARVKNEVRAANAW